MKLIIVILTTAILQVSASGYAQKITLNEQHVSLKKLLNEISKQSGYDFFYNLKLIRQAKSVSVNLKGANLEQALNACFADQPFNYSIEENTVVIRQVQKITSVIAPEKDQVIDVTGKVLDENGHELPGASVKVKGSTQGTVTDQNGNFKLKGLGDNTVLIVSFISYDSKEIKVDGQSSIVVNLVPHANSLNDVVVVAYGTQKKADLTGAVDQITGKELQNRPVTNVGDALQGLMANLNVTTNTGGGAPDATKTINVRGFTDMNGSLGGPLVLVDGVETDINSINATDIASISLLKDAASSAVYGSRAPNGVLLITTKQGQKNQPMQISYSDNFSYAQPLNEPVMSNSLVFANTMNEAYTNAGLAPLFTKDAITRITNYINNPSGTPTTIPVPGSPSWASYDPVFGNSNNDWFKIYLKRWSPSQQHNFSVDGGSDKITYYVGFGTENQNGLFNYFADSYKRDNVRANITADINKYITFSLKTSFAQENDNSPYDGGANTGYNFFHQIARLWPNVALVDPNGGLDQNSYIPQIQQGGRNISRTNLSNISGDIIIKPLPGWDITGHYNYSYTSYNITSTILPYYYSTPGNPQTLSNTVSSIDENYALTSYYMYNFFTSYEKHLGGHYFKVLVGDQTEQKTYSNIDGNNQNLYSTDQPSLYLTSGTQSASDQGGYSWATNSVIGRVNYNYKEKYLLEGNASYMGTSLFPVDTRYHLFPSASAGWNVSKEDFFKPLAKAVDNLKLRVSYGSLGDITSLLNQQNYYPYISALGTTPPTSTSWIFNPGSGGRQPSVSNPGLVSPTLTWAKPSELDFGIDVDFLTDFSATLDWYSKNITDQFGPSSTYPGTLGTAAPTVNDAASKTQGWDLTASWKHQYGGVHVMARATLSHYSGKITKYTGNPQNYINQPYVGESIGAIWGFKTVGKFQTQAQVNSAPSQTAINSSGYLPGDIQYADINRDGKITYGDNTVANPGDQTIIGNSTPKYLYGFTTGASWKGVDVSIFLQGQGRADYVPGNNYFWNVTSEYQSTVTPKIADRWSPANPNGYFPRLDINNGPGKDQITQSGYLLNAAYMRLKNVQLGYTFPNALTQKFHIYQLRLYTSVENALTFSGVFAHQYVDPELLQSDEKIYPLQRSYSFGVKMNVK